ncbi:MAG: hypothetical protein ACFCUI_04855 [Bernardetiaceae bacterium]
MKKTIYTLLILFFAQITLSAQDLTIREEKRGFDGDTYPCLLVKVEDMAATQSAFEDFAKKELDFKFKKSGKTMLVAEKVSLNSIIPLRRGDFLVRLDTENSEMGFAFRMGYDYVLNTNDYREEMPRFRQLIGRFLLNFYEAGLTKQIETAEKEIKSIDSELKSNAKENAKLAKQIEKNEKTIRKADENQRALLENENIATRNAQETLAKQEAHLRQRLVELQGQVGALKQQINALRQQAAQGS